MTLTASDDLYFGFRRRWCPGAYVGYVYRANLSTGPETAIGYFSFGVGRNPVSLEG
jgi:hypothetical protein